MMETALTTLVTLIGKLPELLLQRTDGFDVEPHGPFHNNVGDEVLFIYDLHRADLDTLRGQLAVTSRTWLEGMTERYESVWVDVQAAIPLDDAGNSCRGRVFTYPENTRNAGYTIEPRYGTIAALDFLQIQPHRRRMITPTLHPSFNDLMVDDAADSAGIRRHCSMVAHEISTPLSGEMDSISKVCNAMFIIPNVHFEKDLTDTVEVMLDRLKFIIVTAIWLLASLKRYQTPRTMSSKTRRSVTQNLTVQC